MEDFGSIVYVLIAIGWFFWNAYRKSQQGKVKTPKPDPVPDYRDSGRHEAEEESDPFKSLEDMLLEQLEGKKKPQPVRVEPKPIPRQNKLQTSDLTHSHLPDDYQMSQSEMKSHRVQRQVKVLQEEEVVEDSLMDKLLPNGFDLRQAVVMGAILDRPYD
jgi:hypothetical protein